jgi:ankyrin repeat protein
MDSKEEEGGFAEEKEGGSDEEKENDPALLDAIRSGDVEEASRLVDNGAHFSTVESHKTMPLHLASRQGLSNIVETLLDAGADARACGVSPHCHTPLHLACDALFEKADADKWAAHDRAVDLRAGGVEEESEEEMEEEGEVSGFEAVVGLLLNAGADTEARDFSENTPLLLAVEAGGVVVAPYVAGVIKLLLAARANTEARSHKKQGALHLAARLGDATVVEMLLRAGADAATGRNKFQTPLHIVCASGNRGVISSPATE